jgi:hypothetical protein
MKRMSWRTRRSVGPVSSAEPRCVCERGANHEHDTRDKVVESTRNAHCKQVSGHYTVVAQSWKESKPRPLGERVRAVSHMCMGPVVYPEAWKVAKRVCLDVVISEPVFIILAGAMMYRDICRKVRLSRVAQKADRMSGGCTSGSDSSFQKHLYVIPLQAWLAPGQHCHVSSQEEEGTTVWWPFSSTNL